MRSNIIKFSADGNDSTGILSPTSPRELRLFTDIYDNYEIFEQVVLDYALSNKIERMWFTIDSNYDIKLIDKRWRCHRNLVLLDGRWQILIYYSVDGKRFVHDLPIRDLPDAVCTQLDSKFPGTRLHISEACVNERVVLSVIYNYVNNDFGRCTFDIIDPNIDLFWITPYVKLNMGRKFASAHILALRALKKKLNEKDN